MTTLDPALQVGLDAVAVACRVARSVQQDLNRLQQMTKDDRSPVTVADFAVQAVVALALTDALGPVPIVGEEHASALRTDRHEALRNAVVQAVRTWRPQVTPDQVLDAIDACDHDATSDGYWTLDPVDGTKGFLLGRQYAIALARIDHGEVTLGVMGCPNLSLDFERSFDAPDPRGAMYAATAGGGCRQWPADDIGMAPEPVRAQAALPDGSPIRICESVEAAHSKHTDTERVVDHLGRTVASARLDSQCKYAVVARGQADAYLRMPTRRTYVEKIWDHAAGMLIATEAGATVTDITGAPLDFSLGRRLEANRGVICAAAGMHREIIQAIEELDLAAV